MSSDNQREFNIACLTGNLELVQKLVEEERFDPDAQNNEAIWFAAGNGKLEVVKFLLTLPGANNATQNNYVIGWAACNGHLDVVKFLLTLPGVDPGAQNNEAILRAAKNGHLDVVKFLVTLPGVDPTSWDNQAIRMAAENGHLDIVFELIHHIPNIPEEVITPELESLVFKRACDLSRIDLPAELCWLIGECVWGPGSGIFFGEEKRRKALKKIKALKDLM